MESFFGTFSVIFANAFSKFINKSFPGSINESKVVSRAVMSVFEKLENQNLFLAACRASGVTVVNIDGKDLVEGKPHLVLGLIWQIIKVPHILFI